MMLPPRPLPLSDRIYLRARYHLDAEALARFERLGMNRPAIVRELRNRRFEDSSGRNSTLEPSTP
jgi:hypothetical protein